MQITHEELNKIVKHFYRRKRAVFIQGRFGIGKSAVIRNTAIEIAKELNKEFIDFNKTVDKQKVFDSPDKYFVFVDVRLAEYSPEDVKGMPVYSKELNAMVWELFREMKILTVPSIHGILFLDEINNAAPMIQMVAYKILLDRVIGDLPISENVAVFGAGNTTEDAPVFDIVAPLKDRMFIYELSIPSFEDWKNWALINGIDTRIIAFLESPMGRKLFIKYSDGVNITPRSWEFVSDSIKGINDPNEIYLYSSGKIGEGAARELVSFIKLSQQKYSIEEMLKNPRNAKLPTEDEVDVLYSVIASLAESVREDINNLKQVAIIASRLRGDFSALLIRLSRSVLHSKNMLISDELNKYKNIPEIKKLIENIGKWVSMK